MQPVDPVGFPLTPQSKAAFVLYGEFVCSVPVPLPVVASTVQLAGLSVPEKFAAALTAPPLLIVPVAPEALKPHAPFAVIAPIIPRLTPAELPPRPPLRPNPYPPTMSAGIKVGFCCTRNPEPLEVPLGSNSMTLAKLPAAFRRNLKTKTPAEVLKVRLPKPLLSKL